jgi:hypothetical protein
LALYTGIYFPFFIQTIKITFYCYPRRLSGNLLACGCNVFNSVVNVIQSVKSAATCNEPSRVRGVTFSQNNQNYNRRDFTCGKWAANLVKRENFLSLDTFWKILLFPPQFFADKWLPSLNIFCKVVY